jgi:hypothetical protein
MAMNDLINMMERIRCTPFSNIASSFPDGITDGPSGNTYSGIVGGYKLNNEHITVSYANPSSDPLEIIVTVSWQDLRGRQFTNSLTTKRTR